MLTTFQRTLTALVFAGSLAIAQTPPSADQIAAQRVARLTTLLSLTAGFCEELLYRGFMPAYLSHIFPNISFLLAIALVAILFPSFNMLADKRMVIEWSNPISWLIAFAFVAVSLMSKILLTSIIVQ